MHHVISRALVLKPIGFGIFGRFGHNAEEQFGAETDSSDRKAGCGAVNGLSPEG